MAEVTTRTGCPGAPGNEARGGATSGGIASVMTNSGAPESRGARSTPKRRGATFAGNAGEAAASWLWRSRWSGSSGARANPAPSRHSVAKTQKTERTG